MSTCRPDVPDEVRRLISTYLPTQWESHELVDELPLETTGLDSIDLVELLLACEVRFQVPFPAGLLEVTPLTVGVLIDHVCRAQND